MTIFCKCGKELIKYRKGPGRRVLKIHRDRIAKDYTGIFLDNTSVAGTDIFCPECTNRIATIQVVNGKYVNKLNQGQLGIIRKS